MRGISASWTLAHSSRQSAPACCAWVTYKARMTSVSKMAANNPKRVQLIAFIFCPVDCLSPSRNRSEPWPFPKEKDQNGKRDERERRTDAEKRRDVAQFHIVFAALQHHT